MIRTSTFAALTALALFSAPAQAHAAAPAPAPRYDQPQGDGAWDSTFEPHWSAAPLLGFSSNGLNAGLGIRGGKTLTNHVYVGGTFVYNLGTSTTYYPYSGYPYTGTSYATAAASVSSSLVYAGPEGGYEFDFRYVTLRAYAGVGLAYTRVSYGSSVVAPGGVTTAGATSATGLALWPGATVLYPIPNSQLLVGGDLRFLLSSSGGTGYGITGDPAIGFFAFVGMTFGS